MLVLQGGSDYQVTRDSFRAFQNALAGSSNATFRLYDVLTHPFVAGPATPAVYASAGHVATKVIRDIATWVTGRTSG